MEANRRANLEWFCVREGVRRGPLSWEALRAMADAGGLARDDLVWAECYGEQWRRAAEVEGLFPTAGITPPRPAAQNMAPPPLPPAPAAAAEPAGADPETRFATPLAGVEGACPRARATAAQSWRRMRKLLFAPFDLARWFSIGFCAWLAAIGGGGGCHGNFDVDRFKTQVQGGEDPVQALWAQVQEFLAQHPALSAGLVAAVAAGLVLGLLLAVLFCWLRAHGSFMLLHRLYQPCAAIREAWQVAGMTATSLFWWRFMLGLCGGVALAAIAAGAVLTLGGAVLRSGSWQAIAGAITPLWAALWAGLLAALLGVWMLLLSLTYHFVEPAMYLRRVGVWQAWRVVVDLCRQYPGAVARYYLCLMAWLLIGIAALTIFLLGTCCLGFILLLIPFLNAVALLPFTLFYRGLGPDFLRRWRPDL
jgi:hypothetical protein